MHSTANNAHQGQSVVVQPTERHVVAVDQSLLDVPGQQPVLPRQVVQVLLERLVLELDGLHDLQVPEQVRLVIVLDRERRLLHQVRYLRLVDLVQRLRVVVDRGGRRRRRSRRLVGPTRTFNYCDTERPTI